MRPILAPEFYATALDDSPYFRFYERSPVTRLLLETLPRYLRPGASVLDLGCGNAIAACHLAACESRELTYLGIDPDPAVCEWATRVLASLPADRVRGRVLPVTQDAYLASAPERFDLIVSSWAFRGCLDVRRPETHRPTTVAIADRLAGDGALIVGDAFVAAGAARDEIERIGECHRRLVGDRGVGNPVFPPERIAALFAEAGLERIERHDVAALPLARFLDILHDQYALQVFRRAGDRR